MFPFAISLFIPWIYTLASYIDYIGNRTKYIESPYLPQAFDQIVQNVFIWLPISIYGLLTFYPAEISFQPWYIELTMLSFEFTVAEVWFYTIHRICHHKWFYFIHKKHHEVIHPIGILALYSHPLEALIVNNGSFYITHMLFTHSQFHVTAIIAMGIINTVLYSHSLHRRHYAHHKVHKYNYGHSLFMDKIFGTDLVKNK